VSVLPYWEAIVIRPAVSTAGLHELEQRRDRLRADLAAVGDFRPGSLSAVMRRCGKANCACADAAHPGHGPQHVLTKKVAGKTVSVHLRPGPKLDKARAEVGRYRRFRQLVNELVEVSEAICRAWRSLDTEHRDERPGRVQNGHREQQRDGRSVE